jgi:hypothetical protein
MFIDVKIKPTSELRRSEMFRVMIRVSNCRSFGAKKNSWDYADYKHSVAAGLLVVITNRN